MSKKVISILCLLAMVCMLFVACGEAKEDDAKGTTAAPATTAAATEAGSSELAIPETEDVKVDYVEGGKDPVNCKTGEYGFFGPYPDMDPDTGKPIVEDNAFYQLDPENGMVFDISMKDSWFTSEIAPQEIGHYKYAIIEAKTDDPAGIDGFTMTIGGVGQGWQSWIDVDGNTLPALTTEFQTYKIDLEASGVETVVAAAADIAMNQGAGTAGHVYVKSITFTNK